MPTAWIHIDLHVYFLVESLPFEVVLDFHHNQLCLRENTRNNLPCAQGGPKFGKLKNIFSFSNTV